MPSVNRILTSLMRIREGVHACAVLDEVLARTTASQPAASAAPLRFERELRVVDLHYTYPDGGGLRGVSFAIAKGECLGIVGRSGSGKTTLNRLLLRFLTEQSGHMEIDGVRLDGANREAWRALIGYVPQEVFLMDDSLRANVALGEETQRVSRGRLEAAIEEASLGELVARLPARLETRIGERGARLSGGERQRVGIARALYVDKQVFLFDEMTSALDAETETQVLESVLRLKQAGRTVILIAHRVSTLRHCDRVLELDAGGVRATYSYAAYLETRHRVAAS